MVIKESIFLAAAIVEAVTLEHVAKRHNYNKRVQKLKERGVISSKLAKELEWLWRTRDNAHLFLVSGVEFGRYKVADFRRATRALDEFFDAMNAVG